MMTCYTFIQDDLQCVLLFPKHSACKVVYFCFCANCLVFCLGFHPDVPSYPFDEKFDNFAFNCLLTREEAIVAMAKVRSECNKVASMSVFQVPVSKSMKLEEFEQTQAQVSTQVQCVVYVKLMIVMMVMLMVMR